MSFFFTKPTSIKSFIENPSFNKVDTKCWLEFKLPEYPKLKFFIVDSLKPLFCKYFLAFSPNGAFRLLI